MPPSSTGIFGRGVRERLIGALAVSERGHVAGIARSIGASQNRTNDAASFFEARGLIRVDRSSPTRTWVALADGPLRRYLVKFGLRVAELDNIAPVEKVPRSAPTSRPRTVTVDDLFVTATATRILLHVTASRQTDATELHRVLGIDETVVRSTVARLIKNGVIRREPCDWKRIPLSLNPSHPAAHEISALLRAVVRLRPENRARVKIASRRRTSVIPQGTVDPKYARRGLRRVEDLLPLFHPSQTKILVALASLGPLHGVALAKRIGLTPNGARGIAKGLVRGGLVRATSARSGTVVLYALETRHPASRQVRSLIVAACRSAALPVFDATPLRIKEEAIAGGWPPDDHGRLALALKIFAAKSIDIGGLAKSIGRSRRQVATRIALLRAGRLVKTRMVGPSTIVEYSPNRLGPETTALLKVMTQIVVSTTTERS